MKKFWNTLKKVYIWAILITYPIVVAAMLVLLDLVYVFLSALAAFPD